MNTKLFTLVALTLLLAVSLSGCNTTRGLGQDVEALGEKIENEAEEKKPY